MSILENIIPVELGQDKCWLRSIEHKDLELIRYWKNINRNCFFYKDIISESQQKEWYSYYLNHEGFIFVIEYEDQSIGCIGYRLIEGGIDIYNVIMGDYKFRSRGIMGKVLRTLCKQLEEVYKMPITAKVLLCNSASDWYRKNGFTDAKLEDGFILMKWVGG